MDYQGSENERGIGRNVGVDVAMERRYWTHQYRLQVSQLPRRCKCWVKVIEVGVLEILV